MLRGGSEQFIDEADRSLHDAIMIVRRALKHAQVVPGGGAIEMEVGVRGRGEGGTREKERAYLLPVLAGQQAPAALLPTAPRPGCSSQLAPPPFSKGHLREAALTHSSKAQP